MAFEQDDLEDRVESDTKTRGRKDRSGQEKVIELKKMRDKVETLIDLYRAHQEMGQTLNDGIKAAAEASGLLASVVKKYVVAKAGESFEEKKREAAQLSLAFEQI